MDGQVKIVATGVINVYSKENALKLLVILNDLLVLVLKDLRDYGNTNVVLVDLWYPILSAGILNRMNK